ncbi:MAG: AAA family ATPase [Paraglaciecola sp.]|nr:AAA family ATPase [Paraglaciecola sp.]
MLSKATIRNFRSFSGELIFDLETKKHYEFNDFAIKDTTINHSIIYGKNGCGKSNLGLAILDVVSNLNTDEVVHINSLKDSYLNADSKEDLAEFSFKFKFGKNIVTYDYGKRQVDSPIYETLKINERVVISVDRRKSNTATFLLAGSEGLKTDLSNSSISVVRYLDFNTILDENEENSVFNEFVDFVKSMVFFRTLSRGPEYYGSRIDVKRLSAEIIVNNKVKDFESFLNEAGVDCSLCVTGEGEDKVIEFDFQHDRIEFSKIASTGTYSLGISYYWWLKLNAGHYKFAFIDEFDAFYHYDLSKLIVKMLNTLDCQTVLTTHNVTLLSNDLLRPDCYFEMKDARIIPFNELVDKDLRRAHNLEKIYKGVHSG